MSKKWIKLHIPHTNGRIKGDGEMVLIVLIVSYTWEEAFKNLEKLQAMKRGTGRLPNPNIKELAKERRLKNDG